MKVDIPSGNEETAETKKEEQQETPEAALATTKKISAYEKIDAQSNKTRKICLSIGIIIVLAAVSIIVALVPDWDKQDESNIKGDSYSSTTSQSAFFESTEGPFEVKLPLLSSNITFPYATIEEAKHDIEQLARFIVNQAILEGAVGTGIDVGFGPEGSETVDAAPPAGARPENSPEADGSGAANDDVFSDVTDFETYQQEKGVVRSDFVKSNGDHVFAAMEDRILVWSVKGDLLDTVTMPPINIPGQHDNGTYYYPPKEATAAQNEDASSSSSTAEARSSPIWWEPKPYIQALLITPDGARLTAIVGGYGIEYTMWADTFPIIDQYQETRIIVYEIQDGILSEVSQSTLNGYHADSFSIGDNVHIVTKSSLNMWNYLLEPLQRWQPEYDGMTVEEYEAAAKEKARSLIAAFVEEMLDFVVVDGEITLSRLAVFTDSISNDNSTTEIVQNGMARTITQVHSFDVSTVTVGGDVKVSTSAILNPGYWGYVYATSEWIWVADQGFSWIGADQRYFEDTIFLGFKLDGASSAFSVFGSVPGTLLNQFSLDFYKENASGKEYIRAATTINLWWGPWWGAPQVMDTNASRTHNQVIIMELPVQDGNHTSSKLITRGSVELGKKDEVSLIVSLCVRDKITSVRVILTFCVSILWSR
jgi:hypothetical protein